MGDLTRSLSRHEFRGSDGQDIAVDFDLVNSLQDVTDAFASITGRNVGIKITSGYRSPQVNAATPGASITSYHLKGMAADFYLYFKDSKKRIKSSLVYNYLDRKNPVSCGISLYHNRCLLYTSPSPRDGLLSRMPSSA